MAYATNINDKPIGQFVEKKFGLTFQYELNPEKVLHADLKTGRNTVYPHLVFVGHLGEKRRAFVKKTVAYVVTDEIEHADGRPWFVIEKWDIKNNVLYNW